MRILYLAPWFPYPLDTGSRTRVYYLLRSLSALNQVTLLSLNPQGWAPAQVEHVALFCEQALVIDKDPFQRSWIRKATRFASISPIVADPFHEMLQACTDLHSLAPFGAVISGTVIMAYYALALPGVVRILEEHNSGARWMAERYEAQTAPIQRLRCWISWRKAMRFESRLFSRFNLVGMVSEQDAAASRALLPGGYPHVLVFPNGVDCTQLRPDSAPPLPDTLIFSGALTYSANYEAMAFFLGQIYPRIRAAYPQVKLRITGAKDGVKLQGLALDPSVTLTGYVEDIHREIAQATVAIVPIRSGGGTRLKILEAMALGTPIVATTKGAEGIESQHGEHLLLADNPADFADCVVRLLLDAGLRQRLSVNARRLVATTYDWSAIGQHFVASIESTVADRPQKRS